MSELCQVRWGLLKRAVELANEHSAIANQMMSCAGTGDIVFYGLAKQSLDASRKVSEKLAEYHRHCQEHGCSRQFAFKQSQSLSLARPKVKIFR